MIGTTLHTFVAKVLLVVCLPLGSFASSKPQKINTILNNEIVLEGGNVELTLVKPLPKEYLTISCGVSDKDYSGFLTNMKGSTGKLQLLGLPNQIKEFKGRISVKNDLTTVISNITFKDEGRSLYCSYMTVPASKIIQGDKHKIKSVQVIPKVHGTPLNATIQAREGQHLTLQWQFVGRPLENLTWSGRLRSYGVPRTTKFKRGDLYFTNVSLYLSELKPYHNGLDGSCTISNYFGSAQQSTRLHVLYTPKNTSMKVSHKWRGNLAEIQIECKAWSNPNLTVYTYYKGSNILAKTSSNVYSFITSTCFSSIFMCVPSNELGDGAKVSQKVTLKRKPVIEPIPRELTVPEDNNVRLFCNVTGCPIPSVNWYKDNRWLWVAGPSLTLLRISPEDRGVYTCVAKNMLGKVNTSVSVNVQYSPRDLTISSNMPNKTLKRGQALSIACNSRASPTPFYTFYRGNETIGISINGTLIFAEATCKDHVGLYSCKASNKLGEVGPVKINIICLDEKSPQKGSSMAKKTVVILVTVCLAAMIALSVVFAYMFKRWSRKRQVSPSKEHTSNSVFQNEKIHLNHHQTTNNVTS